MLSLLLTDFLIAFRNLVQHTKRTIFLGGAIAMVTALLVLLVGLSQGVKDTMLRSATTLACGHLNIGGFYKVTAGQSAPVVTDYEKALGVAKKALPELDYAVARGRGWARLVSDTHSLQVGIGGIDIAKEPGFRHVVQVVSGSIDDLAKPNTILIFEEQAKKLDAKIGDALTFVATTSAGKTNTIDIRVVAIAKEIGLFSAWNTYVPSETLRRLYDLKPETTGAIYLYLKDLNDLPGKAARLRTALAAAGYRMMDPDPKAFWMKFENVNREDWTGQKLDVTLWEDEISFVTWVLQALQGLTGLLIGTLLAIVIIGIMNTMWIAIRERTREIGTLRAVGMQRGRVLWMFLCEAMLLGLFGTAIGALIGTLASAGVNALQIHPPVAVRLFLLSDRLILVVQPASVIRSIVAITIVTGLAALYPALRAAKLKPVTAMSHFG